METSSNLTKSTNVTHRSLYLLAMVKRWRMSKFRRRDVNRVDNIATGGRTKPPPILICERKNAFHPVGRHGRVIRWVSH